MSASHPTSTERHLTYLYTAFDRRTIGASPDEPIFEVIPFGDPSPGVVKLYALTPIDPLLTPAVVWLDEHIQAPR